MPFIQVGYKKIHYADWEPENGVQPRETFVWIHGLGSSQNYYTSLISTFTTASIRCVCLDTTGQARSPYTGIEQSVSSLAADVVGAMDVLGIEKAVVVGHSMAGLTVPEVAARYPNRVSAAILLGPVWPNPAGVAMFQQRIDKVEKDGMQPMADTIPYAAVGSDATPLHRAFIRELLLASQPAGYISLCRVINAANADPAHRPPYANVSCPLFIVAGAEDKAAPPQHSASILEAIGTPAGEKGMVVLEKTGHWMAVEKPERTGQEMLAWWESVR